ncbi:MAG: hypothetical protein MJZ57_04885, partial [Bacteroidales bacterium]|nr:hypothetical protein [Bacteroidales bacterium]
IYFDYTCDSLLTIHIPQNVYNQIKEGDTVKKEVNDCNVVIPSLRCPLGMTGALGKHSGRRRKVAD